MENKKVTEEGFAGINYRATSGKMLRNNFIQVPDKNKDKNK